MKKTIFLVLLICTVFIACKKDNSSACTTSQTDGKLFEYIEKDTVSSFFNKKTIQFIEVANCQCKGCITELRIYNLTDKEIEIKVFQDSAFTNLYTTETLPSKWGKQKFYGVKDQIDEFILYMKVIYK